MTARLYAANATLFRYMMTLSLRLMMKTLLRMPRGARECPAFRHAPRRCARGAAAYAPAAQQAARKECSAAQAKCALLRKR